jgi:uncharacterized membrane protein YhaH (DUF805 family)
MPSDATFGRGGPKGGAPLAQTWGDLEPQGGLARLDQLLFSFNGRIPRLHYWLIKLATVLTLYFTAFLSHSLSSETRDMAGMSPSPAALVATVLALLMIMIMLFMAVWASLAAQVKRWHDRGKSWTWALLGLVPIVGWLWQGIECGYLEGTLGLNRFGPSPKGITGVTYKG